MGKIIEIEQNDVTNDVLDKSETWYQKMFCQIVPLIALTNFTSHNYFEKIKLSCSKRRWSSKISEIEQSDVTSDVIDQKRDTVLKK